MDLAKSAELSSATRCEEAEGELAQHKDSIKRAKKTLSFQLTLENIVPGPPKTEDRPGLPIFRV